MDQDKTPAQSLQGNGKGDETGTTAPGNDSVLITNDAAEIAPASIDAVTIHRHLSRDYLSRDSDPPIK